LSAFLTHPFLLYASLIVIKSPDEDHAMPSTTKNAIKKNEQSIVDTKIPSFNLIRLPAVKRLTTLSVSQIYRRMEEKTFPKRVLLGPKTAVWLESEVLEWVSQKVADRDSETFRNVT
tara:strand:- start:808 stop:1158 length:351 start_codon:yes stop_codon:yes gene_type:complete